MVKKLTILLCVLGILVTGVTVFVYFNNYGNKSTQVNDEHYYKVGIYLYRDDDDFIATVKEAMTTRIEEINEKESQKIKLNYFNGKNQKDIQLEQIKKGIEDGYDALAINLVDRSNASVVIDLAKEADIPVVFFNREPVLLDMARWDKIYYVGIGKNPEQCGIIQGTLVADYWMSHDVDKNHDGILQYVMLQGQPRHQDAILRSKYSIFEIEQRGINTEALDVRIANWNRIEAKDQMNSWLNSFGDEIEFVISNNDAMALGAIDAMNQHDYYKNDLIPVVGVDAIKEAYEALENGQLVGTVLNDATEQAYGIISLLNDLVRHGQIVDKDIKLEYGKYLWSNYKIVR